MMGERSHSAAWILMIGGVSHVTCLSNVVEIWPNSAQVCTIRWLVGGLEHSSIFPYIGNVIIPIDFHIFQRGRAQPPTRWSESWKIPGPSGIQGASTHGEPPPAVAPMPRKKETPVPYLPMDQHVSDVQLLQAQSGCCYWACWRFRCLTFLWNICLKNWKCKINQDI